MNRIVSSRSLVPSGTRTTAGPRPRVARFVLAAVLAAGLNACLGSRADALTYFVDRNNAACLNNGAGTELQPYCTITAAVNARGAAGNTIMVKPGTYREQVTINASGASGSPIIVQAFASGVVISGADDFSSAAQWTLVSGNVWLASGVNWYPKQVFLDGARCDSSALAVGSLTPRTFRWVSGTGLYVNAGGGSPASHAAQVGHRNYGFSLFGRSFITIDGFNVIYSEDRGIYLNGSCTNVSVLRNVISYTGKMAIQVVGGSGMMIGSNNVHDCMDHGISFITNVTNSILEDNESYRNARPIDRVANGIYLFGCPNNTIRQNRTHDNEDTGIHLQSGSNNCISYLNRSYNNGDHGYDHLQAMGTIHNCDVAYGNFKDGFSIEGNATGTQLHNCIAVENGLTTNEFDLWVDSGSTTGFVSDYNIFWNSTTQPPVKYIATLYPTVAAYSTASGKDAHTLQADPRFVNAAAANFHLLSTSPAIDNANSGSPNWPTLDADDNARFNANGVPNTGVGPINYGDRGAYEFRTSGTNQAPNGVINTPTAATTIVAGQSVSFTCTGSDPDNDVPLAYAWNFAGGAPNSSLEDPGAVVFNTAGTYTVSLTVTDALGMPDPTPDTRVITVTANTAPNGVINTPTGPVTIAAGQSVNFTSTGSDANNNLPLTYFWNFGGGATNSTVEDPGAVVFATAGTYTVTLVVTDALGLADPTPDTRTITVTSPTNQAPNSVINTPAGPTTIIAGQSVNFTGTGTDPDNNLPLTFAWNFGGGATNSTVEDPGAVVFATAGTYTVSFTVRDGLGLADPTPDTRVITVTANTAPNGVINTPTGPVTIAAGQSVNFTGTGSDANNNLPLTFLWNFGGGATNSTVEDPGLVVFTAPGTYTVSFTVTDALGLADPTPDTRVITVTGTNQAPNGTISSPAGPVTITAGQSVTFNGSGSDPNNNLPLTYLWNFGGGATNSTVQNPGAVVFATAGTYTVSFTVTDALGLADPTPDTRVITVNPAANQAPNGVINTPAGPVTITAGQTVNFTGTGTDPDNNLPLTFAWNFGGGATNSTVEDPGLVTFATAGTFTVSFTVTDGLGLADATPDTRVITVNPVAGNQAPNGTIGTPAGPVTITAGQTVSFTGSGIDPDNNLPLTYAWNFGGGAANSTAQNPGAVAFANAGTFTVSFTVTDGLGLADPTPDTRVITVNPISGGGCAQNIAANPSFESGTTGWKGVGGTIAQAAGGSAGSFSLLVTGAASTSSFYVEDSPRNVLVATAGSGYHYTAMVRSAASTGAARIRIMEYLAGVKVGQLDSSPVTLSQNWQKLEVDYTPVQTGSEIYFTVKDNPVAVSETFNVDDVSICPLGAASNQAPNGVINTPAGPVAINAGQSVNFTGTGTDPDNNLPLTYAWNFGGGATNSTLQNPGAVVFATAGTYTVTFTVRDGLGLADATPDTRVVTVTGTANQAPNGTIATPVGPVTIVAGQSVSFTGGGVDPDNNLPLTYAWNFGGGAANSTVQNPNAVVFATAGSYTVSFTVTDGLGASDPTPDTRVITVTTATGNQAPNGTISSPAGPVTITAGQSVTFNGSATDPDNNLPLTYAWNFGGGAANSTVQSPGLVAFANAGTFTVSFTVTDGLGLADPTPDTRVITVNPASSGGCTANLLTNPSFETGITGWKGVGGTIAQVAGGSAGSFSLRVTGAASTSSFYVEDSPRTVSNTTAGAGYHFSAMVRSDASVGTARIRVMEYLANVKVGQQDSPAVTLSPNWQKVEVSYTPLNTGSVLYFTVKDNPVAISETFDVDDAFYCPGAAPALVQQSDASQAAAEVLAAGAPFKAFVAPNPMVGLSQLKFSTTRSGPLRVAIFDVTGRRVRMVVDDAQAKAGLHIVPLDDRGDNGSRLDSGLYFYRIRSADGLEQGRFLIMN